MLGVGIDALKSHVSKLLTQNNEAKCHVVIADKMTIRSNIAKSTTDPRVEFISQVPKKS